MEAIDFALPGRAYFINRSLVLQRGYIAQRLTQVPAPYSPAHDLGVAGLRQVVYEQHLLWRQARSKLPHDSLGYFLAQAICRLTALSQDHEDHHNLTLQ